MPHKTSALKRGLFGCIDAFLAQSITIGNDIALLKFPLGLRIFYIDTQTNLLLLNHFKMERRNYALRSSLLRRSKNAKRVAWNAHVKKRPRRKRKREGNGETLPGHQTPHQTCRV